MAVAAHLGMTRFAVQGTSGGGPYALACAALMPDQVQAVILTSAGGRIGGEGGFDGMPEGAAEGWRRTWRDPGTCPVPARDGRGPDCARTRWRACAG